MVASYALSCSLLPLSLLLNSLDIHLMLRHTDAKRRNSILQSYTGWLCAQRSAAFTRGVGFKSEDIVFETQPLHVSMNDSRANEMAPLESLGLSPIARTQLSQSVPGQEKSDDQTVTENFPATRIDTKRSTFKGMMTNKYSSTSPSHYFRNSTHRGDI